MRVTVTLVTLVITDQWSLSLGSFKKKIENMQKHCLNSKKKNHVTDNFITQKNKILKNMQEINKFINLLNRKYGEKLIGN